MSFESISLLISALTLLGTVVTICIGVLAIRQSHTDSQTSLTTAKKNRKGEREEHEKAELNKKKEQRTKKARYFTALLAESIKYIDSSRKGFYSRRTPKMTIKQAGEKIQQRSWVSNSALPACKKAGEDLINAEKNLRKAIAGSKDGEAVIKAVKALQIGLEGLSENWALVSQKDFPEETNLTYVAGWKCHARAWERWAENLYEPLIQTLQDSITEAWKRADSDRVSNKIEVVELEPGVVFFSEITPFTLIENVNLLWDIAELDNHQKVQRKNFE